MIAMCNSFAAAFTAPLSTGKTSASSLRMVAVDPSVVTKKEYEDICGITFDSDALEHRLRATNFLYPKHVEVINDIAPIAGAMVDEVVSCVIIVHSLVAGVAAQWRTTRIVGIVHPALLKKFSGSFIDRSHGKCSSFLYPPSLLSFFIMKPTSNLHFCVNPPNSVTSAR